MLVEDVASWFFSNKVGKAKKKDKSVKRHFLSNCAPRMRQSSEGALASKKNVFYCQALQKKILCCGEELMGGKKASDRVVN